MPASRKHRRPPPSRTADPARTAALEVLRLVRTEEAYTNLVLPSVVARLELDTRDAAFATELAAGTIRRQGTYDAILAACIDRPLRRVEFGILDILRLGCHQLLGMRVPAHAAISSTVDLAHAKAGRGAGGFVNAVLRAVTRRDLDTWIAEVAPQPSGSRDERMEHLTVKHSHPRWVVDLLDAAAPDDDLDALLAADNVPPKVTLVARPGRAEVAELPGTPTLYSPYGVVLDGGDPARVPAVAEGRAGVQDEGSQLVALALASAPVEGADKVWVDLCAGPGGKAALLAAIAAERGAGVLAVEQHLHRAGLVRRALGGTGRLPGVLGLVSADGTRPPLAAASADRVLVDAPCTGLGALRRRPEARWRRSPDDLLALVPLQRRLLASALELVRPGGVVLYATCSPVRAETVDVVSSVLGSGEAVALEDVRPLLPGVTDADGPLEGTAQLWPHRHGTDAMFLALLRRGEGITAGG
ncbi:RsmB/NOP family class I SAM-dependent RNA methyltransferase [Nocardioides bizhenqiangii]|uniref:Transcription antitermination factor NusB n=1 Tax=Nocardioides bizhenqiangii TaxID=3095076 RepID=A0ABZ0ZXY9_9ACTN|nr:transcription antitermination factor NusB [Nocardioides sp. HM61]WQQ28651.1 transcription antitermination factor NusB [Nocardioides sp. HM61]